MSGKVLLVVDDEASIRALIRKVLHDAGYQVLESENGAQALELLRRLGGVDLLVSDIMMPVMDGIALARSVAVEFPAVPLILISGFAGCPPDTSPFELLPKPFLPGALLQAVNRAMGSKTRDNRAARA